MATLSELRKLSQEALDLHHSYERRIKKILEARKKTCPHEKTKIVSQEYFEAGRMSGPVCWEEKVCCRCKKVLATRSKEERMTDWHEAE